MQEPAIKALQLNDGSITSAIGFLLEMRSMKMKSDKQNKKVNENWEEEKDHRKLSPQQAQAAEVKKAKKTEKDFKSDFEQISKIEEQTKKEAKKDFVLNNLDTEQAMH